VSAVSWLQGVGYELREKPCDRILVELVTGLAKNYTQRGNSGQLYQRTSDAILARKLVVIPAWDPAYNSLAQIFELGSSSVK